MFDYLVTWIDANGKGRFITDDGAFDLHAFDIGGDVLTISARDIFGDCVAMACVPYFVIDELIIEPIDVIHFMEDVLHPALWDSFRRGGRTVNVT